MKIPEGMTLYELRGKHGRKHVVIGRWFFPDYVNWEVGWPWLNRPTGLVRWYMRSRGERWRAVGDWFSYYPEQS